MNKLKLLITSVLVLPIMSMAQEIKIEDFQKLDRDMSARTAKMKDVNGELCALLKIETTRKGFEFSGCNIEKTEQKTGEIWVFVSPGVKFITIKHKDFGVLRNFQFPQSIEGGTVYTAKLIAVGADPNAVTDNYLVIKTQLTDAKIYINNEYVGPMAVSKYLPINQVHSYRIEAFNYHTVEGKVTLSEEEKTELNITLKPAFGYLKINTIPKNDVSIEIDNQTYKDSIPFITQLASGNHNIQVFKQMYKAIKQQFEISDGDTTKLNLTLEPNFAEVQLIAADEETKLYVDDIYKAKGSWKGLLVSGNHKVEAKKNGYLTYSKTLNVEVGKNIEEHFPNLELGYGKLNINTNPIDAKIHIDGKRHGTTPNVITLLVGKHHIRLSKKGYVSIADTIDIKETGQTTYTFDLTKGQDKNDSIKKINIATDRIGDKIYINNIYVGLSPIENYPMTMGQHKVEVERNGVKINKNINITKTDDNNITVEIEFPITDTIVAMDNNKNVNIAATSEQPKKSIREIKNRFFFTGEYLYTPTDNKKNTYGFTLGSIKAESFGWYFSVFSNFDFTGLYTTNEVRDYNLSNYSFTDQSAITRLGSTLGIVFGGRTIYFKIGAGYGMRLLSRQKDDMEWINIMNECYYEGFEANIGFQLMLWRFVISADIVIPINGLDLGNGSINYDARFGVGFNF